MDEKEIDRILRNASDIRWDTFMALAALELQEMRQAESPSAVLELLNTAREETYQSYPRVLFKVLKNISDPAPIRHCLALLWQLVEGSPYASAPVLRRAALGSFQADGGAAIKPPSGHSPSSTPSETLRSDTAGSVTRQLAISNDQPVLLLASAVAARLLAALPQEEHLESGRTIPLLAAPQYADRAAPGADGAVESVASTTRVLAVAPGAPASSTAPSQSGPGRSGASAATPSSGPADRMFAVTESELRAADELMAWIRGTLTGCNRFLREQARAESRRRAKALREGLDRGRTGPHGKPRHHEETEGGKGGTGADGKSAAGGGSSGSSLAAQAKEAVKKQAIAGGMKSRFDRDGKSAMSPREIAEMSWKSLQLPADTRDSAVVSRLLRAALDALMVSLESRWLVGKALALRLVDQLVPVLRHEDPEVAYRATFCLWVLSMDAEGRQQVGMQPECIPVLVSLIRPNTVALKVIRLAVAALRQCSTDGETGAEAVAIMEDAGLREALLGLGTQRKAMEDAELQADARGLVEALDSNDTALTAVDRYRRELRSGSLRWSGLHTAAFWEENSALFEQKNFEVIRNLAAILGAGGGGSDSARAASSGGPVDSKTGEADDTDDGAASGAGGSIQAGPSTASAGSDPETICVACHDLGEFAVHHPSGKLLCHQLGVKAAVMLRLDSKHPDVSRHALLAVSKMMIARWEFTAAAQKAKEEEEDQLAASEVLAGMGGPRVGALG